MGFRVSYAIVNPELIGSVMEALDLTIAYERSDFPDWEWSLGVLEDGRYVVCNDRPDGLLTDEVFWDRICSPHDELFSVSVNETSMVSQAFCMSDGVVEWSVEHDWGKSPDHLAIEAIWPPDELDELVSNAKELNKTSDADHFFDVPVDLVAKLTGYRYDTDGPDTFARLRPAVTLGMLALPESCVDEALRHFGLQRTDEVVEDVRDAHWSLVTLPSGLALLATSFRGTPIKQLGDVSLFADDQPVWKFQLYESGARSGLYVSLARMRGHVVEASATHLGWEARDHLECQGEIDGLDQMVSAAEGESRGYVPLDLFESITGWVLGETHEHVVLRDVRVRTAILN